MRGKGILATIVSPLFLGPVLAAEGAGSMTVFVKAATVQERKDVDEATKNALKAKKDAAKQAREALEKQLKEQHGKKRESWPPEKDDALYQLEEAEALAAADYEYRKIELKGINDAVKDVTRALEGKGMQAGRKEHVALVPAETDAELVVEIAARRASKTLPTQFKPDSCFVLFSIGPGARLAAERFGSVPSEWRPRKFMLPAWKLAGPSAGKQAFTFEASNGGGSEVGCHGAAANAASTVVDKFIDDNYALLRGN
jgi:hypothetical protein